MDELARTPGEVAAQRLWALALEVRLLTLVAERQLAAAGKDGER
jgi:hypothetical protein